jgi:hypothetical protein
MSFGRFGGLLLLAGSVGAAYLAVLAFGGAAVGLGGADVNGQYVIVVAVLIAGGMLTLALVRGGTPLTASRFARIGAIILAVGLLAMAASSIAGASAGLAIALGGVVVTFLGGIALGTSLLRSPGAGRSIGFGVLGGPVLVAAGTIGPRELQPLQLLGGVVLVASIAALGVLAALPLSPSVGRPAPPR